MEKFIKHGNLMPIKGGEAYKHHCLDLGMSDIAQLTMLGCRTNGIIPEVLKFGGDGDYSAYLTSDRQEIPPHYSLVAEYECEMSFGDKTTSKVKTWLKIYDDHNLVAEIVAKKIEVYRAGDYGCLIYVEEEK